MRNARRQLHWFRRDLRLADNPALDWASAQGNSLIAVYVHAPEEETPWPPGAASRWWLHHSLLALRTDLARRGIPLLILVGDSGESLGQLCARYRIDWVSWNRRYEPVLMARDQRVERQLGTLGVAIQAFDDGLFCPPGSLLNQQGQPYRVFTPFMRALRQRLQAGNADLPFGPPRVPHLSAAADLPTDAETSPERLDLLPDHPWHTKLTKHWQPGEAAAWDRLQTFLEQAVDQYAEDRDRPDRAGTSRLSPYLHFGEISPWRILGNLQPLLAGEAGTGAASSAERFLSQLGWREFARHLLWHFPDTDRISLDRRFEGLWREDAQLLARWQRGETGIPLVDAGMRELWETGWMHNRVRMLVGSLLTKNLGIPWQAGARWFWDTLVDADLANNSLGWQWIAGCGADAAPYFRVFNPALQARKFDPDGRYQARWLPSGKQPEPICDLAESRAQALARYEWVKRS